MANVVMPQLGETVIEGTIIRWLKREGEPVELDEPLFEISTDKVDTEVPSPSAGTLQRILVPEGTTVAVGTELAVIGAATSEAERELADETPRMAAPADGSGQPAEAPTGSAPVPQAPVPGGSPIAAAAAPAPPPAPAAADRGPLPDRGPRSRILSPIVRRLAAEHDVDLARVEGTGTGGRITRADVEAAIASGTAQTAPAAPSEASAPAGVPRGGEAPAPPAPAAPVAAPPDQAQMPAAEAPEAVQAPASTTAAAPLAEGEHVEPLSHLRRAIASHMLASSQTTARAWTLIEVDMENVVRVRNRTKEAFGRREGFKLTYMPFVTRATNEALLEFPMVNAELRGEEVVLRREVHMGIAVSIEGGLIVPVIANASSLNLVGLARAIDDLAKRARSKQLTPDEVRGSTFSITNPGAFGSLTSVPIINQPNTAILSFDAIEKRPVVIDDAIAIRHRVYLSMSWDHRVIDGEMATRFLGRIKEHLESWDWDEDLQG